MKLDEVEPSDLVEIVVIEDFELRQNLRFLGIIEKTRVHCLHRIRSGPMVIRASGVTLGIGMDHARKIEVKQCIESQKITRCEKRKRCRQRGRFHGQRDRR